MNVSAQHSSGLKIPFDHKRLDRLMDEAGIDVVVATSKHNVQYLLGGHRANFFDYMDATGVTRYLPVLVYPKGAPEKAAYFGHRLEKFQTPEQSDVDAGDADQHRRLGRRHAEGGRLHPQGRPQDQAHRRRIRLPALRRLDRIARRVSGRRLGRCACSCWNASASKNPPMNWRN